METEILSETKLAERMGVSRAALNQWRCQGVGPAYIKAGRRVLYSWADVLEWMDSQKVKSGS